MTALLDVRKALERPVTRRDVQKTVDINDRLKAKAAKRAKVAGYSQKDVTYPTNTQYSHGFTGFSNQPGVAPDVISTIYRTRGISRNIPFVKSVETVPLFKILTSQAAASGSEPADACSRGPTPGKLSEAQLTAPFGLLKRSTETVSLDRIGQVINRAEPMDLRVINNPDILSPWVPETVRDLDLQDEERVQIWRLGLEVERKMETDAFQANGTNQGAASTQGYKGFYGLDSLINTGKTDIVTGSLVPAADSLVISWANASITATQAIYGVNTDLVTLFARVLKYMEAKAVSTAMLPISWRWAMRPDLFWELTAIWPCSYLTNLCTSTNLNGGTQFVSANDQIAMRDEMRNGSFIYVNGMRMPVDLVDTNAETAVTGGTVKSDIYLIPYTAAGFNTLYWQYFDFSNPQAGEFIRQHMPTGEISLTDAGRYAWTFNRTSFCFYAEMMLQARLILRTAFLAARITNIQYPSTLHSFDAIPSGLYFQQGGGSQVGSLYPNVLYSTTSV